MKKSSKSITSYTEKPGGYISKLILNNTESINIEKNDIVVFVGPNNAGKSQCLRDIYTLSKDKLSTIIIKEIELVKNPTELQKILNALGQAREEPSYVAYSILGQSYTFSSTTQHRYNVEPFYDDFRELFVANLSTDARLTICNPPKSIRRDESKKHPIHYAAFIPEYRKWLSDNFQKAFNIALTPNIQYGSEIPLCIGENVHFDCEYEDEQSRMEAYGEILANYPQVQNQGDGIRSFTGILLYLMMKQYCTYLIDEPESFLHPPQAYVMGQIIAESLSDDQQAFIATHSEELIKGLLTVTPSRIKLIRITREGNINKFSILNKSEVASIWGDPLLKHSNIMSSLFHKTVVLCESDSDCKMYSLVEEHLKRKENKYSEALFIHCGGKQRMHKIISALRSLGISIKLIPDIDLLRREDDMKNISTAMEIDWELLERNYRILSSQVNAPRATINRQILRSSVNTLLDQSTKTELSKAEVEAIQKLLVMPSQWTAIKQNGESSIPAGDASQAYFEIKNLFKEHNIFIVPVGELECFIKTVGKHGPEWVNNVLEKYPDFDDPVYEQLRKFIDEMDL